jgi:putative ABC transport system substrate-binding protein
MRRREFIALLGGGAAWPLAGRAQQVGKIPTIGLLVPGTHASHGQWFTTLVERLRELDWIEGRTLAIEYRWTEGRAERVFEIAAEFARLKVDVIVTSGTPQVLAAKRATSVIPIVFATAGDPVDAGLVASLARPGGNVTGLALQSTELTGKRLELLREVLPSLRRLALLGNPQNPSDALEMHQVEATARTLTLEILTLPVQRPEEIEPAFESLKGRAQALYVISSPLAATKQVQINALALAAKIPTMHHTREYVETGGLMSYGPNFHDHYRRAADLVDKILRGTKPADIPVEQPTNFDLTINLKTAKALGLTIPPTLLARADKVIE